MLDEKKETASPAALVVFAGGQIRKTLTSIAWAVNHKRIDALFIYQTPDNAVFAEKLRIFCTRQWPSLKTVMGAEAGTMAPAKVAERLRDWRIMRGDITAWTIDSTSATPSMLAAVSRVVCEYGGQIINFDHTTSKWLSFEAASGGRLLPAQLENGPESVDADSLSLPPLLELASDGESALKWHESRAPLTLSIGEIADIFDASGRDNWNWCAGYREVMKKNAPVKWGFEDFLGALIKAMGVRQTRVNVAVSLKDNRLMTHYGVVALKNATLWTFDCDINETEFTPALAAPWKALAQRVVLIRPTRLATRAEKMFSSPERIVLDSLACNDFLNAIAKLFNVALPESLTRRKKTSRPDNAQVTPLTAMSAERKFMAAMRKDAFVYDLRKGAEAEANGVPAAWSAAMVSKNIWIICGTAPRQIATINEARKRFESFLARTRLEIKLTLFDMEENRLNWFALVRYVGAEEKLVGYLARWRNMPLIV